MTEDNATSTGPHRHGSGCRSSGCRSSGSQGQKHGPALALDWRDESGSATAEYAIATLAAVGFAGLLVVILRSAEVRDLLTGLISHALSYSG